MNEIFDPVNDYEDAEALAQARKLKKAQDYLKGQEIGQYASSQANEGTRQACEELGITPEQFAAFCNEDPISTARALKKSSAKFVKKVVESKKGKGPVPVQQQGRHKAGSYEKKVAEAKAKGRVTDDELCDILGMIL